MSREHHEWRAEYQQVLPDLQEEDICGSCFSITHYAVDPEIGGNQALERLYKRLHERRLRLLLDFVPNHTALDHPWVQRHPEFYVRGTDEQLHREPQNYVRIETSGKQMVLAYGRDPYFSGWPDTLQLNYSEPSLQEAMRMELLNVAATCDGVRCDMAMLILPEVFAKLEASLGIRRLKPGVYSAWQSNWFSCLYGTRYCAHYWQNRDRGREVGPRCPCFC